MASSGIRRCCYMHAWYSLLQLQSSAAAKLHTGRVLIGFFFTRVLFFSGAELLLPVSTVASGYVAASLVEGWLRGSSSVFQ